jgi:CRP/FNR family transcriptional regulator
MLPDCKNCKFKSFAANTLDLRQLVYLQENCSDVEFRKGEVIFREGVLSLNIAYIKTGLVKLHMKGPAGRDQIIKVVKAPNYLGIPTTVGDKINQYSATALDSTSVCFINIDTFKNLLLTNKDFAYQIITDMCHKELENFRNCIYKIQKHTPGLIADALLNFASSIYNSLDFELPLTRQELADLIGTSRENVSRTLSDFQKDGLIILDKKRIKITDMQRLIRISGLG